MRKWCKSTKNGENRQEIVLLPSKMEVASSKIEVSPFFVDFHDLRTFVAIYILSRFTHFFRKFFLAKIAISATKRIIFMYAYNVDVDGDMIALQYSRDNSLTLLFFPHSLLN